MSAFIRTPDGLIQRVNTPAQHVSPKAPCPESDIKSSQETEKVPGNFSNRVPFTMTACETREDREAAFKLVHRAYLETGLSDDNPTGMRVMKHHLLDTTDIMVAKKNDDVCFTVTLVRDGDEGLPAESLFPTEIDAMRAAGIKLAEVSCVASDCADDSKKRRFETLVKMISMTIHVARRRGVDRLLLAVHPRHAKLYRRMFGCLPCSQVKEYDLVCGNPALLCMHDFSQLDKTGYALFEEVYGSKFSPWQLDGTRMSAEEKRFLAGALQASDDQLLPMAA